MPIDDVWAKVKGNYTEGFANSVVGNDGKVYGIPVDYYPWAVFYRKSVFADKGYTVPTTWDDLKALCTKMQADGLTPIAFGDKDGWPAMGTFDILNLRLNGYDFHVDLMAGKEKWTDPKVTTVFQKWAEIVPYHAKDYAGLTWQNAADTLVQKKSGMYLLGPVRLGRSSRRPRTGGPRRPRLLPVPDPRDRSTTPRGALDAPIDTFMISAKSPNLAAETGRGQGVHGVLGEGLDPAASCSRTSRARSRRPRTPTPARYSALQKKAVADRQQGDQQITQFLDRDTRAGLRRRERHAELPAEVPREPDPGPGRLPEDHPGLLGLAASARPSTLS